MVALHHQSAEYEEPSGVERARADLDQLLAGLPRALLASTPEVVRAVAARAFTAQSVLDRWEARIGERPDHEPGLAAAAAEAKARFDAVRARREQVVDHCARLLARGNAIGVGALGIAGAMVFFGGSPMDLPVAVAVVAAPLAPLTAGWMSANRSSAATRDERSARQGWADALEKAGAPTMGALAARQLALKAWERRGADAAAAAQSARPHLREWYLLAGPGVHPGEVEQILERVEAVRRAQIALLGALLDERVESMAMSVLAPPAEVSAPDAAPGWLADALIRFRSSTLRLWSNSES